MTKSLLALLGFLLIISCIKNNDDEDAESENNNSINYKQEMREFVIGISQYAKSLESGFFIIPQNGVELVTTGGTYNGNPELNYLNAIDGNGQESLYFGYPKMNQSTPVDDNNYLRSYLNISKNTGNKILVTDYCSNINKVDDSYNQNHSNGFVSFAANQRELNNIPAYPSPIYSENANHITALSQIQNFLYLINPENYTTKTEFINAVTSTNYDLLIMDLFFNDGTAFSNSELIQLKNKANGGKRLVIAYLSIGEAEEYRYYWQSAWNTNKPSWLDEENPNWPGNYKVKYWVKEWQDIIFGNDNSYLKKILDAGFDGAYLDIIDAYNYYE